MNPSSLPRRSPAAGLVLLAFLLTPLQAQANPADLADAASERFDCGALYDAGDYPAAVDCFESLALGGNHNGHLLYNLGNAHYRAGAPARALLAYRRASLYLPRDGDLKANLASTRGQVQDDLDPPDVRSPLMSTLLAPYDGLSQRELLLTGAVGWLLLILVLGIRTRRPFSYATLAFTLLGGIALFGLLGGAARSYQTQQHPIAVLLAEEATVRSGRDLRSTDLVRLHAGAELRVLEHGQDWMQVGLSNGTRGWLPSDALGLVRPL
jgi:tetratricopeptide (TPR) repeat protein